MLVQPPTKKGKKGEAEVEEITENVGGLTVGDDDTSKHAVCTATLASRKVRRRLCCVR